MPFSLEQIAAALRVAEAGPAAAELADAPAIGGWSVVTRPGEASIRLRGRVTDHPEIEEPWVTTSPLLALDAGDGRAGWARTLSCWYRVDTASFRPSDPAARAEELAMIGRTLRAYRRRLGEALSDAR